MAGKNKNNKDLDDELEDDIEELDEDLEGSEEEEEEPKKEEAKEEDSASEEDSDEEGSEEQEEKSDPDREAIRARRRREKKMKRERDRREKQLLEKTIITLAEEVRSLKSGQGEVNKRFEGMNAAQINNEIKELGTIYQQAQKVMEEAIADGDGKRFTEAKALSDKAWARYNLLEAQKRQTKQPVQEPEPKVSKEEAASEEQHSLGEQGKRYGISFIKKHSSWYDPSGSNRDSKIVQAIDLDLYQEGYDPETKEYWDELEDRAREVLPNRFKSPTKKPKSTVGGGGRDSSSSTTTEKSLPKEFVQTLKAAGYWEDDAKRKAAIKNYYAQRKGA